MAVVASTLAPAAVVPAQAAVAGMSAVDPQNGYPTWFSDGNVKLQYCYMAGAGCLSEPPNPDAPASYPDNFPEEAFWFSAEASSGNLGLYEAALEGAHLNGTVTPGEQMGFGRLRFRIDNLVTGASYTVQHPYGTNTFTASAGRINTTIDAGTCAPTETRPCDWAGVGEAFLGTNARTTTSTFLKQVGAAPGTLGDINTARPVTGAPSGLNEVVVTGPNAGGAGVDTLRVTQFTVQGLIFDGADAAPSTPDLAADSDSGRSTTDNITNLATPTFTGTVPGIGATEASVQLMVDGATTPAAESATLNGAYSLAPTTALTAGVHRAQVRTPNPAYAVNPDTGAPLDPAVPQFLTSGTLTFTVDTVAPAAALGTPLPSNPSADTTPTVPFTTEAGATTECQLLPSNTAWSPCVSPMTYDQQLDGNYTFNVRATDAAGNVGTPATYSWRIGQPDTTAPILASQNPQPNATSVPVANNVTATFSEAVTGVDGTSMVLDDPAGNPVPAAVTYNATNRTATLNPTNNLASGTRYTLSLSNLIEDVSGNAFAGSTSNFTTVDTAAPTVTTRTPAVGAVNASTTGNVTATFNEPVTGVSNTTFTLVDAAGDIVPAAVTYNATTRTATLNPTADLAGNATFTAELSAGVTDVAGNPFAGTVWDFTTGAAVDTTAPPAPTVNPATGTYTTAQSVTMADAEAGAVIRYTVGTGTTVPADPTATSAQYTAAVNVDSSQVVKAAAFDAAGNRSTIVTRTYTINLPDTTAPPAPTVNPATGTYTTAQSVTMADAEAGAVIRYTVGTGTTVPADPTTTSAQYTAALNVGSSQVIKAAAFDAAGNRSAITQRNYTINIATGGTRTVTLNPVADVTASQSTPTTTAGSAVSLKSDAQVTDGNAATRATPYLRFTVPALAAGESISAANLSLQVTNATTNGPAIWRTATTWTEGTMTWNTGQPARSGTAAVGNFGSMAVGRVSTPVSGITAAGAVSFQLYADAIDGLDFASRENTTAGNRPQLNLTIRTGGTTTPDTTAPPAPTVNPATGTYTTAQSVTMADAEAGAVIRYTVGTGTTVPADPTAASPQYTAAVNVGSSQVIKAAAFDAAGNRSAITQRNYTISTAPTGGTRTVVLNPVADVTASQLTPTTVAGSAASLKVDQEATDGNAATRATSYLRFTVPALAAGESISAANLSLQVTNATTNGPAIWRTATTWNEATMTWNTGQPARSGTAAVGNFGAMAAGRIGTPVSGITAAGDVSFQLYAEAIDGLDFASRENTTATNRPQLTVTIRTP